MNLVLLVALLFGTQIGLTDGLILPTLVAQHGQGTFVVIYVLLKFLLILPVLQAELVAGRIYRVTPFEFCFLVLNKTWARLTFGVLLLAAIFVLATNLFNTSWAVIFGLDGLKGSLLELRPLDQKLYWFEQSQDVNRIMSLVIIQGMLLILLGGLAWRGIASIFVIWIPVCFFFIVYSFPSIVKLFFMLEWPAVGWSDLLVAMQHALASSMAGLLIWYVLGTKISDALPTGRVIISVQLFDVLFGMSMLSISWPWITEFGLTGIDAGAVLRALTQSLSELSSLPFKTGLWLVMLALTGLMSSLPLLLLVAQEVNISLRQWLLASTVFSVVCLSAVLVYSHGVDSPLFWYGRSVYDVVQWLGFGLIIPTITAGIAVWIGWIALPNRVLKQINPHGGIRYFLWRIVLRFIVPMVLSLVFIRASLRLMGINLLEAIFVATLLIVTILLFKWVKKHAVYPSL